MFPPTSVAATFLTLRGPKGIFELETMEELTCVGCPIGDLETDRAGVVGGEGGGVGTVWRASGKSTVPVASVCVEMER